MNQNVPVNLEHIVRKAKTSEAGLVCDILASAFTNDPVVRWMSDHPKIYASLFRAEADALYMKNEHVFINETQTGAAMWLPPGVSANAPRHWRLMPMLWNMFRTGGLKSLNRGDLLDKAFSEHHFQEPHFYLHSIGAKQSEQGKGVGSALLRTGLQLCDQQRANAYLESSNLKNNALYERHGFAVIGEIQLPDSGPTVWSMLRKPK